MNHVAVNIALVMLFIVIGGFFAGAEMALVSLRESQIRKLSKIGKRGARVAKLAQDPNRFLSAVQIGVTLAGFLSAAFGASTLAGVFAPVLVGWGLHAEVAEATALILITLVIAFVSLVLGELAPKRLAMQRAEGLSLLVAPLLDRLASLSRPVIWALSKCTDGVVRLFGGDPTADKESITTEELRDLVIGHEELTADERAVIAEVFAAGKRQLREVLLPRTEVEFMDAETPLAEAAAQAAGSPHSRFPVFRGSYDDIVGFVHVRDLLDPLAVDRTAPVGEIVRPVKLAPASKRVLAMMTEMRHEGHHLAIVVDEYGGTAGIVTLEDLVEEVIGDIRDEYDVTDDQSVRLGGGDMEVDGLLNLDAFADETGIALAPGPYETVAGYIMAVLGHLPDHGDTVDVGRFRCTVIEMDGRRVARVRVSKIPADSG
ncbi:hemolysin family protein [Rhizohabitans arisaemae]|uniref:hemolysin family protein n=1 Tax=Rhizohabitans arisaemae TaxID=2720610 RepID=UPI0024B07D9D|nr:hemolysin family protein [Rhizohabitans arisaemae]